MLDPTNQPHQTENPEARKNKQRHSLLREQRRGHVELCQSTADTEKDEIETERRRIGMVESLERNLQSTPRKTTTQHQSLIHLHCDTRDYQSEALHLRREPRKNEMHMPKVWPGSSKSAVGARNANIHTACICPTAAPTTRILSQMKSSLTN
jgi:hypothetical protein